MYLYHKLFWYRSDDSLNEVWWGYWYNYFICFKMKKAIICLVVFVFTLVSNTVAAQTARATANATVTIAEPLTIVKNVDLNFGTVSAPNGSGTVTVATDGTVTTNGGVTIIDQSLISAASFGIFGPSDTSYTIELPKSITLRNGIFSSLSMYDIVSNPQITGILDSAGTGTVLVGASITVDASQRAGVYQGDLEITVNLN